MSVVFYYLGGESAPQCKLLRRGYEPAAGKKGQSLHWHTLVRQKCWLLPTLHHPGVSGQGDSVGAGLRKR
eukprot:4139687-Lingulodinium_polyedra.AAC.1